MMLCLRHEGRTWYTAHRGRLWIAATAKQPSSDEIAAIEQHHRSFSKIINLHKESKRDRNFTPVSVLFVPVSLYYLFYALRPLHSMVVTSAHETCADLQCN